MDKLTLILQLCTLAVLAITALLILKSAKAGEKSAQAANKSVRETKRAMQAQLYVRLMEYYASKEMFESLRLLRIVGESKAFKEWKKEGPDTFSGAFAEAELSRIKEGIEEVEKDYRHYQRFVKYYFLRIYHLDEQGFLPKHLVKDLLSVDGINLFFEVVRPLEYLENENFDSSNFDALYERAKKLGIKELPNILWKQ
jgi:hypothetical protein